MRREARQTLTGLQYSGLKRVFNRIYILIGYTVYK